MSFIQKKNKPSNNNMTRDKIAIILANDGSDVRIGKVCRSLCRLNKEIHFIGWDREPDKQTPTNLGATVSHLLKYSTKSRKLTILGRIRYIIFTIKILKSIKPNIIIAVNEDTAFQLLLVKRVLYRYIICDIFDPLPARCTQYGFAVRKIARLVGTIVYKFSDKLIATDSTRFDQMGQYKQKTIIVENVPEDPGPSLSLRLPIGDIKIWVAGSLHRHRGLKQILLAIDRTDATIIAAGWPNDVFAQETFIKHPKVKYLGVITAPESLQNAAKCDAVFAYYAPISENNINASPNKLHDAMSIGRPIILNSEVKISDFVREKKIGWTCPYNDVDKLTTIIDNLGAKRNTLPSFAIHARSTFKGGNDWSAMEKRLATLLNSLG